MTDATKPTPEDLELIARFCQGITHHWAEDRARVRRLLDAYKAKAAPTPDDLERQRALSNIEELCVQHGMTADEKDKLGWLSWRLRIGKQALDEQKGTRELASATCACREAETCAACSPEAGWSLPAMAEAVIARGQRLVDSASAEGVVAQKKRKKLRSQQCHAAVVLAAAVLKLSKETERLRDHEVSRAMDCATHEETARADEREQCCAILASAEPNTRAEQAIERAYARRKEVPRWLALIIAEWLNASADQMAELQALIRARGKAAPDAG